MKHLNAFRFSLFAAAVGAILFVPAQAAITPDATAPGKVAYSTFESGPFSYDGVFEINPLETIGYQFSPTRGGKVSSISVMIGSDSYIYVGGQKVITDPNPNKPFTLSLYADDNDQLGTLLGSFTGVTGDLDYNDLTTPVIVPVTGVTLTAGKKYWLVASKSDGAVYWDTVDDDQFGYVDADFPDYTDIQSSAFNVRVGS